MTTYEKIRAKRNEMYPPVLEFGCEVENIKNGYTRTVSALDLKYNQVIYAPLDDSEMCSYDHKEHFDNGKFKILGKPLTTNDILLMIGKDKGITTSGHIIITQPYDYYASYLNPTIKLDLTKSIKDQTPETIDKLWEIIK